MVISPFSKSSRSRTDLITYKQISSPINRSPHLSTDLLTYHHLTYKQITSPITRSSHLSTKEATHGELENDFIIKDWLTDHSLTYWYIDFEYMKWGTLVPLELDCALCFHRNIKLPLEEPIFQHWPLLSYNLSNFPVGRDMVHRCLDYPLYISTSSERWISPRSTLHLKRPCS